MTSESFDTHIRNSHDLVFFRKPDPDGYYVMNRRLDVFHVPHSTVSETDWDELEMVLMCRREPKVMKHMSRIVGYYSLINNWNRSKLIELKDRQRGNYAVEH